MDNNIKIVLVAPVHITPTDEWINALPDCDIIIVDDSNGKVKIDKPNVRMFDYIKQKELLGDLYEDFEKFHKSSSCKNFGHWLAYNEGYDVIIGIDSDCVCPPDIIEKHLEALSMKGGLWENPLYKIGIYPRGYPYWARDKEVVANVGLWRDCLDLNGQDRIENEPKETLITDNKVSLGIIPFSGMNWSIKAKYMPLLMFIPNFGEFRRHDDIFGGYIFQKFLKKAKKCLTYGLPIVRHDSIVIAEEDAKEEIAMNEYDKMFYEIVDIAMEKVSKEKPLEMLYNFRPDFSGTLFGELESSFNFWRKLWQK
jgi:hypothetical protein